MNGYIRPSFPNRYSFDNDVDYYEAVDAYIQWSEHRSEADIEYAEMEYRESVISDDNIEEHNTFIE